MGRRQGHGMLAVAALLLAAALLPGVAAGSGGAEVSRDDGSTFSAAVLQYFPLAPPEGVVLSQEAAVAMALANINAMAEGVLEAAASGAELVVLPEDSLYGDFGGSTADPPPVPAQVAPFCEPLPSRAAIESGVINPCAGIGGNYSGLPMLTSLSCLATRAGVVLVASAADAGADGSTCYNTQLAFDANGRLLAKYHKQHLFAEPQFTAGNTTVDNMVVFDALGVTFGMAVCFDIMFSSPMPALMEMYGVSHFVTSLWWVNQPPLMTMTQYYAAWSRRYNVTILAAGSGQSWAFAGSGIFVRGSAYASSDAFVYPGVRGGKPVVVMADNVPSARSSVIAPLPPPPPSPPIKSNAPGVDKFVATAGARGTLVAKSGGGGGDADGPLVCTAEYVVGSVVGSPPEIFALYAYEGMYPYNGTYYRENLCAFVRCTDLDTENGCIDVTFQNPLALYSNTAFDAVSVTATGVDPSLTAFAMGSVNTSLAIDPAVGIAVEQGANRTVVSAALTPAQVARREALVNLSLFLNPQ